MGLPPIHCRPTSITSGSVESSMIGRLDWVAKRDMISSMSEEPSSPV